MTPLFRRIFIALAVAPFLIAAIIWLGLPSRSAVRALAKENPGKTGVMRQREEEAKDAGRQPKHTQSWVPLSRMSRNLIHAVVTAEDAKFFGHEGVDWDAMQQSLEKDWKEKRFARGGSTITQQLAKNLFFSTRKNPLRKIRELIVARWLEQDLDKKRILELYLNVIEWGDGVYGVQAAAQRYYGKPASALSETEAAGLAAMIPSPRRLNPRVDATRHARAQRRVLWLMGLAGYARKGLPGTERPPPPAEPPPDEDEALPVESEAAAPAPASPDAEAAAPEVEAASPPADAPPASEPAAAPPVSEPAPSPTPEPSPDAPRVP